MKKHKCLQSVPYVQLYVKSTWAKPLPFEVSCKYSEVFFFSVTGDGKIISELESLLRSLTD